VCQGSEERIAGREMAIDGPDADTGVRRDGRHRYSDALTPNGNGGRRQDPIPVVECVAPRSPPTPRNLRNWLAHVAMIADQNSRPSAIQRPNAPGRLGPVESVGDFGAGEAGLSAGGAAGSDWPSVDPRVALELLARVGISSPEQRYDEYSHQLAERTVDEKELREGLLSWV
jgi:hypothetical protein